MKSLRVLMVISRIPSNQLYGRMTVIRTAESILKDLGASVEMVYVVPARDKAKWIDSNLVARPSAPRIMWNILRHATTGNLCLNECLFFSNSGRSQLKTIIRNGNFDLIICDMLRVYELVCGLGVPVFIDFDDLLSERYKRALRLGIAGVDMLGYVKGEIDRFGSLGRMVIGWVIAKEYHLIRKREISLAKNCVGCSVVSRKEAQILANLIDRKVSVLPMALRINSVTSASAAIAERSGLVFLGKMDYAPNLDAINYFSKKVLPLILEKTPNFVLDIIGYCPDSIRDRLAMPGLNFIGYVPDLNIALKTYKCMLAPLISGSGIKTKILDSMAAGLPIIGTDIAFEGIDIRDGHHVIVANTPTDIALAVDKVMKGDENLSLMADSAQKLVAKEYGYDVVTQRWRELLIEIFKT